MFKIETQCNSKHYLNGKRKASAPFQNYFYRKRTITYSQPPPRVVIH